MYTRVYVVGKPYDKLKMLARELVVGMSRSFRTGQQFDDSKAVLAY